MRYRAGPNRLLKRGFGTASDDSRDRPGGEKRQSLKKGNKDTVSRRGAVGRFSVQAPPRARRKRKKEEKESEEPKKPPGLLADG